MKNLSPCVYANLDVCVRVCRQVKRGVNRLPVYKSARDRRNLQSKIHRYRMRLSSADRVVRSCLAPVNSPATAFKDCITHFGLRRSCAHMCDCFASRSSKLDISLIALGAILSSNSTNRPSMLTYFVLGIRKFSYSTVNPNALVICAIHR